MEAPSQVSYPAQKEMTFSYLFLFIVQNFFSGAERFAEFLHGSACKLLLPHCLKQSRSSCRSLTVGAGESLVLETTAATAAAAAAAAAAGSGRGRGGAGGGIPEQGQ